MGIEGGSSNNEIQSQEINQSNNEQAEINQAEHQRSGEELEGNSTIDNEGERKQIEGKDEAENINSDEASKLDNDDTIEDDSSPEQQESDQDNNPEQMQLDNQDTIEDESNDNFEAQSDNINESDSLDSDETIEDDTEDSIYSDATTEADNEESELSEDEKQDGSGETSEGEKQDDSGEASEDEKQDNSRDASEGEKQDDSGDASDVEKQDDSGDASDDEIQDDSEDLDSDDTIEDDQEEVEDCSEDEDSDSLDNEDSIEDETDGEDLENDETEPEESEDDVTEDAEAEKDESENDETEDDEPEENITEDESDVEASNEDVEDTQNSDETDEDREEVDESSYADGGDTLEEKDYGDKIKETFNGDAREAQAEFNDFMRNNVWNDASLSNREKIDIMKANFDNMSSEQQKDFNVIGDARIISNDDYSDWGDGKGDSYWPDVNWPEFPGLDGESINNPPRGCIDQNTGEVLIPEHIDRLGSPFGNNTGIVEGENHFTQDERAIAYIENINARNDYSFNGANYKEAIDAVKDFDLFSPNESMERLNNVIKSNNDVNGTCLPLLDSNNPDDIGKVLNMQDSYSKFQNDCKDFCEKYDCDSTYGLMGETKAWDVNGERVCNGGADQINTPINLASLERLGLVVNNGGW